MMYGEERATHRSGEDEITIDLTNYSSSSSSSATGEVRGKEKEAKQSLTHPPYRAGDAATSLNTTAGGVSGTATLPGHREDGHSFSSSTLPVLSTPMPALSLLPWRKRKGRGRSLSVKDGDDDGERDTQWSGHPTRGHPLLHYDSSGSAEESELVLNSDGEEEAFLPEATDLALRLVADATYRAALRERAWSRWVRRQGEQQARQRHGEHLAKEYYDRNMRYLFFRAWQWRFSSHVRQRHLAQRAEEMAKWSVMRRAMSNWRALVLQRRAQMASVSELLAQRRRAVALSAMRRWWVWQERRALAAALEVVSLQVHQAQCVARWTAFTIARRQSHLLVCVCQLYTPPSWGSASGLPHDFTEPLLRRSCWLQWLRVTCQRRGARLQRYEANVKHIQEWRERAARESAWQRWLLCTVSAVQCRRQARDQRQSTWNKWLSFARMARDAEDHQHELRTRRLHGVFEQWHDKFVSARARRRMSAMAETYYDATVRTQDVKRCFRAWRHRTQDRCRRRHLREAGAKARKELLQHLGVRRLVEGVLLHVHALEDATENAPSSCVKHLLDGQAIVQRKLPAPLPLERSCRAPAATFATREPPTEMLVLLPPDKKPRATVDRASSPVAALHVGKPKVAVASTQTEGKATYGKRTWPPSLLPRRGRLPLFLRSSSYGQSYSHRDGEAPPVQGSSPAAVWSDMSLSDLKEKGRTLVSAYRSLAASAAAEGKVAILIELELEQLYTFHSRELGHDAAVDWDDRDDGTEEGDGALVVEARVKELQERRGYLSLREQQRKRLRAQVEALEAELRRRCAEVGASCFPLRQ